MAGKMNEELVKKGLDVARNYAAEIESAVAAVQDKELRAAIGGALMGWVLAEMAGRGPTLGRARRSFQSARQPTSAARGESLTGTQARIMELADEGFFAEPRLPDQVRDELRVKAHHHDPADVRMSLLRLARKRLLRRVPVGEGKQKKFAYVQP